MIASLPYGINVFYNIYAVHVVIAAVKDGLGSGAADALVIYHVLSCKRMSRVPFRTDCINCINKSFI